MAHELAPWIVTAHMLVALVIVQLLLWATVESLVRGRPAARPRSPELGPVRLGRLGRDGAAAACRWDSARRCAALVDDALPALPRAEVLASVGALDTYHRELAAVVTLVVVGLWVWAWLRHDAHPPLRAHGECGAGGRGRCRSPPAWCWPASRCRRPRRSRT